MRATPEDRADDEPLGFPHSGGEGFWSQTLHPLSRFESEADFFAWAAIWTEWSEGESA